MMMTTTDRIFRAPCNFSPKTLQGGSVGPHARHQPDYYDHNDYHKNDYCENDYYENEFGDDDYSTQAEPFMFL